MQKLNLTVGIVGSIFAAIIIALSVAWYEYARLDSASKSPIRDE
jgi:uncharacterized protein involved in exopolysaccharide biosynthesis